MLQSAFVGLNGKYRKEANHNSIGCWHAPFKNQAFQNAGWSTMVKPALWKSLRKLPLEVTLDTQYFCSKLSTGSWALLKLRAHVNISVLKTVYYSLIYFHLPVYSTA